MKRLAAALVLAPSIVAAQDFPALYGVSGVATDDVLNIRAEPNAQAEIIGEFAADRQDVEVVASGPDGSWGQVNAGEQSGWASLSFLERQPDQPAGEPIARLSCSGTEPFWSFSIDGDEATFGAPDQDDETVALAEPVKASGRTDRWSVIGVYGGTTAILARASCSDGMSSRAYGLTIDLLRSDPGAPTYLTGCCSVSP